MVSIVTTDLHAVSFDNSFNISESKANKPGYHPCTISGNSARVQVGTDQASSPPQVAQRSPILRGPRIMSSKHVCYNFFNCRQKCCEIECFAPSGWEIECLESQIECFES